MKNKSTTSTATYQPQFSLAVAARALAASTVSYLEPQARGMTFTSYDAIAKDALLPPFSNVVHTTECGKDISSTNKKDGKETTTDDQSIASFVTPATTNNNGNGSVNPSTTDVSSANEKESAVSEVDGEIVKLCGISACLDMCNDKFDEEDTSTADKELSVAELKKKFSGDYEILEEYDQNGKEKVRCLIAVVHGRVRNKPAKDGQAVSDDKEVKKEDMEYVPGSMSISYRGTDTLANVVADVKAIAVPYDDPPFMPAGVSEAAVSRDWFDKNVKGSRVHHGFKEAWYGDELRKKVLQVSFDKIVQLNRENKEAHQLGLTVSPSCATRPTIDIVGHSLGGSIAILAAYDLANTLSYIGMSKQARIRSYTFGCPRVGNVLFVNAFNRLVPDCWNVINDNDIVPAIPHSPSMIRRIFPFLCQFNKPWYKRHGHAVILKVNAIIVDPSRRQKYRREAKVLRLKKAVDSHMTKNYRDKIQTQIQAEMPTQTPEGIDWAALSDLLDRLEQIIGEARSDPTRSIRFLPGGT